MIKNILIVTEAMMPFTNNWGACQRVYHYAKLMKQNGMNVSIICRNSTNRSNGTELVEGIEVCGTGGTATVPNEKAKSNKKETNSLREKLKKIDRNVKVVSDVVRGASRFVYSEPNVLSGYGSKKWAENVSGEILSQISDKKIDAVILSGPSFGSFYLADKIKQTGVKLILDYRDPWTCWYEKYSLAESTERKAVQLAELIITTTAPLTEALKEKYNSNAVYTIMNGYDKELWNEIEKKEHRPEKLVISYIGAIKINGQPGFRDATVFLNTAKEFLKTHDDVEVQFVGVRDPIDSIDAELRKVITFKNTVPVKESLEMTAESDVLLIFHTPLDPSGKYIICGKAFDCLKSGNYVLSIGDKAYANKQLIESTGIGMHCNNNQQDILHALEEIYAKWKNGSLGNMKVDTESYSRDYQNTKLLELIRALN